MGDGICLQDDLLPLLDGLFVAGDEHIVIDAFVEVEVGQCLLVGRLGFNHLLHLLYVQLADRVQVLVDFTHYHLLRLAQRVAIGHSASEGKLDGLRKVLGDCMGEEVPSVCLRGMRGGIFMRL